MGKIYAYNNSRNFDIIPTQLYIYPVSILLGNTLNDVKNSIEEDSDMFLVYTSLKDSDIIVRSDIDRTVMEDILKIAGIQNIRIKIMSDYIWYSNKVKKNIIISDTIDIDKERFGSILYQFFDRIKREDNILKAATPSKYYIHSTRNGSVDGPYLNITEARDACDRRACTVVKDNLGNIVYKSKYGKAIMIGKNVARVGTSSVGFSPLNIKLK